MLQLTGGCRNLSLKIRSIFVTYEFRRMDYYQLLIFPKKMKFNIIRELFNPLTIFVEHKWIKFEESQSPFFYESFCHYQDFKEAFKDDHQKNLNVTFK